MALRDSTQDSWNIQQRETPVELDSLLLDTDTIFGLTSHYLKRKQKVITPCPFACFVNFIYSLATVGYIRRSLHSL